jgi:hypothetical protein
MEKLLVEISPKTIDLNNINSLNYHHLFLPRRGLKGELKIEVE